jgi:hypothetical protein
MSGSIRVDSDYDRTVIDQTGGGSVSDPRRRPGDNCRDHASTLAVSV